MSPFICRSIAIGISVGRDQVSKRLRHPHRQWRSRHRTHESQQQALRQKLPHQADAPRAHRQAYPELLVPRRGARQQQVGHIRAHNQQHHAAHRHQNLQRCQQQGLRARVRLPDGQQRGAHTRARVRVLPGELLGQGRDFGIRLLHGHARFRPRQPQQVTRVAVPQHPVRHGVELRRHHQRNPGFERQPRHAAAKLRRSHADHRQLLPVHAQCAADRARVAAESPLPKAVADHGHRIAALLIAVLLGREEPSGGWLHAQHGKVVSGYQFAPDPFGTILIADTQRIGLCHGEPGQQFQVVPVILVIGIRTGHELAVGRQALQRQQLVPVRDPWNRPHQHHVDPTENRRAGRDAYRQRQHRDQREARALEKHPESEPQISRYCPHELSPCNRAAMPHPSAVFGHRTENCSNLGQPAPQVGQTIALCGLSFLFPSASEKSRKKPCRTHALACCVDTHFDARYPGIPCKLTEQSRQNRPRAKFGPPPPAED